MMYLFSIFCILFQIYAFILKISQIFLIDFMHACTNLCINLCIGAPSVRCCPVFDTDGAVSEMATPHRTAGHPNGRHLHDVKTRK